MSYQRAITNIFLAKDHEGTILVNNNNDDNNTIIILSLVTSDKLKHNTNLPQSPSAG